MGYEDEPDYEGLKNLFKSILAKNGYSDDKHFDWFNLKVSLFFLNILINNFYFLYFFYFTSNLYRTI